MSMVETPPSSTGFYALLGNVETLLPSEDIVIDYLPRLFLLSPKELVDIIVSRPEYDPVVIHVAMHGMDFSSVAKIVSHMIDRNYPSIMERLNTDENAFVFYRDTLRLLYDRINEDVLNNGE